MLGDAAPSTQIVSPWLMPVDVTNPRDRMLALSVDLAQRSSAVSWICSELSLIALSARLRLRTQAKLSDNYDVLLRHFDPRVLPVLHRVLEAHQRDAFFNLGHAWLYLDRESALCEILLTRAPVVEPLAWSLDLNDMQAAALLDAAEIDAVMPQLVNEDPERFIALGNGAARYQFTSHWLERARHWKLEQFPQKVVLCTLALRLGPGFDEQPAWQSALSKVARAEMRFGDAIEFAMDATAKEGETTS